MSTPDADVPSLGWGRRNRCRYRNRHEVRCCSPSSTVSASGISNARVLVFPRKPDPETGTGCDNQKPNNHPEKAGGPEALFFPFDLPGVFGCHPVSYYPISLPALRFEAVQNQTRITPTTELLAACKDIAPYCLTIDMLLVKSPRTGKRCSY